MNNFFFLLLLITFIHPLAHSLESFRFSDFLACLFFLLFYFSPSTFLTVLILTDKRIALSNGMIYCAWISIKFSFSAIFFLLLRSQLLWELLIRFFVGFKIKIVRNGKKKEKKKKFKNINSIKMNFIHCKNFHFFRSISKHTPF